MLRRLCGSTWWERQKRESHSIQQHGNKKNLHCHCWNIEREIQNATQILEGATKCSDYSTVDLRNTALLAHIHSSITGRDNWPFLHSMIFYKLLGPWVLWWALWVWWASWVWWAQSVLVCSAGRVANQATQCSSRNISDVGGFPRPKASLFSFKLRSEEAVRKGLWVAEGVGFSGKSTLHPEIVVIKGWWWYRQVATSFRALKNTILYTMQVVLNWTLRFYTVCCCMISLHIWCFYPEDDSAPPKRVEGNSLLSTVPLLKLQTIASYQSETEFHTSALQCSSWCTLCFFHTSLHGIHYNCQYYI